MGNTDLTFEGWQHPGLRLELLAWHSTISVVSFIGQPTCSAICSNSSFPFKILKTRRLLRIISCNLLDQRASTTAKPRHFQTWVLYPEKCSFLVRGQDRWAPSLTSRIHSVVWPDGTSLRKQKSILYTTTTTTTTTTYYYYYYYSSSSSTTTTITGHVVRFLLVWQSCSPSLALSSSLSINRNFGCIILVLPADSLSLLYSMQKESIQDTLTFCPRWQAPEIPQQRPLHSGPAMVTMSGVATKCCNVVPHILQGFDGIHETHVARDGIISRIGKACVHW